MNMNGTRLDYKLPDTTLMKTKHVKYSLKVVVVTVITVVVIDDNIIIINYYYYSEELSRQTAY